MALEITPVPCLRDNYAYLLRCSSSGAIAVVDPSEPEPIFEALDETEGELCAIWNTHHHWDHTGGNEGLLKRWPELEVLGHASDRGRIPGQTHFLEDQAPIELGELRGRIRHIPAHTTGAIAYVVGLDVFTGDTLFLAGCGRLFEGTAAMMFQSLKTLGELCEPESRLWVGHEYTAANLRFAQHVEPENRAVAAALEESESSEQTVPGTWAQELLTNPFVRAATVEQLAERRLLKDTF